MANEQPKSSRVINQFDSVTSGGKKQSISTVENNVSLMQRTRVVRLDPHFIEDDDPNIFTPLYMMTPLKRTSESEENYDNVSSATPFGVPMSHLPVGSLVFDTFGVHESKLAIDGHPAPCAVFTHTGPIRADGVMSIDKDKGVVHVVLSPAGAEVANSACAEHMRRIKEANDQGVPEPGQEMIQPIFYEEIEIYKIIETLRHTTPSVSDRVTGALLVAQLRTIASGKMKLSDYCAMSGAPDAIVKTVKEKWDDAFAANLKEIAAGTDIMPDGKRVNLDAARQRLQEMFGEEFDVNTTDAFAVDIEGKTPEEIGKEIASRLVGSIKDRREVEKAGDIAKKILDEYKANYKKGGDSNE